MLHTTSNAWARWITQSYKGATTDPSKNIGTTQRATVWNRGITGKNQVVGVGDSGLATKNCLFNDPATPMTVATGATFNSKTHRKVAQYVAFADGTFQKLKKMKNVVKMCCHYTRIVIIDYCGFLILLMVELFLFITLSNIAQIKCVLTYFFFLLFYKLLYYIFSMSFRLFFEFFENRYCW